MEKMHLGWATIYETIYSISDMINVTETLRSWPYTKIKL